MKSNAVVCASTDLYTMGIGTGQPNRLSATSLALQHSKNQTKGAVLASDGFIHFDESIALAVESGITAIIQPG